jgi:predicted peptidase
MRFSTALTACVAAHLAALPTLSAEITTVSSQTQKKPAADFEARAFTDAAGRRLRYRLLSPDGYETSTATHPLLVFLHGAGQRGYDNEAQLAHGKSLMQTAARRYGCFVLVPQCPSGGWWAGRHWSDPQRCLAEDPSETMELLLQVIARLEKEYRIDASRLYIMGLSMGGFGVWDAIERWPDRFAAAVPICGGGDQGKAASIAQLPIWVFHGQRDPVVPADLSREMVSALKAAGGNPRYTEFAGVGHNSWTPAFHERELLKWLTAQKR